MRTDILIFCDSGLGNRINALASGLAVARYFGLTYRIHWPINNWCAAPFEKIFANKLNVSTESISQLRGKLDDAIFLLHDEIAASTLNVKFDSAYRFKDLSDFAALPDFKNKTLFYFPALIPNWMPMELVHNELRFLKFNTFIVKEVKDFISKNIPGPFYGLHLRRTDLNVGLSDLEVFNLAKAHSEAAFFVCSDDPQAEMLAASHPNIFRRDKKFRIEKKTGDGDWLSQTHDDDGRLYYGNILRSEYAVIEGAIDMLILGHSKIVGYSGSTFQRMAQLFGFCNMWDKSWQLKEIKILPKADIKKSITKKLISQNRIIEICNQLTIDNDLDNAIDLFEFYIDNNFQSIEPETLFNLAILNIKKGKFYTAILILNSIIKNYDNSNLIFLNLALAYYFLKSNELSFLYFSKISDINSLSNSSQEIYEFLKLKTREN